MIWIDEEGYRLSGLVRMSEFDEEDYYDYDYDEDDDDEEEDYDDDEDDELTFLRDNGHDLSKYYFFSDGTRGRSRSSSSGSNNYYHYHRHSRNMLAVPREENAEEPEPPNEAGDKDMRTATAAEFEYVPGHADARNAAWVQLVREDSDATNFEKHPSMSPRENAIEAMKRTPGWTDSLRAILVSDNSVFASPSDDYARMQQAHPPSDHPSKAHPDHHADASYHYRPYDIPKAIRTLSHFQHGASLLRYSPVSRKFALYRRENSKADTHAVEQVFRHLVYILRRELGEERFPRMGRSAKEDGDGGRKDNDGDGTTAVGDFVVVLSTGDSPKLKCDCMTVPYNRMDGEVVAPNHDGASSSLEEMVEEKDGTGKEQEQEQENGQEERCDRYDFATIWQFGSGFVHPDVVPTSITFPPWAKGHLDCFADFARWKDGKEVEDGKTSRREDDPGGEGRIDDKNDEGDFQCWAFREVKDATHRGLYFGNHYYYEYSNDGNAIEDNDEDQVERKTARRVVSKNKNRKNKRRRTKKRKWTAWRNRQNNIKKRKRNNGRKNQAIHHQHRVLNTDPSSSSSSLSQPMPTSTQPSILRKHVYDKLLPQIIWRGTDFSFLNCFDGFHKYNNKSRLTVQSIRSLNPNKKHVIRGKDMWRNLVEHVDGLGPRWKGVVFSLQAERDAAEAAAAMKNEEKNKQQKEKHDGNDNDGEEQDDEEEAEVLPWIDAKFTNNPYQGGFKEISKINKYGIHVGSVEKMHWDEAWKYKYHIDFGGGGGTTWSGVSAKLALPGVLFHHETATYDWFHEDLIPWVHYIPVAADLSDLRAKFEWAEAHPRECLAISEAATAFVRYMGSGEYWERIYDRLFVKRLRPAVDAYIPMEVPIPSGVEEDGRIKGGRQGKDDEVTYDEVAFLDLARELGYPLKKLYSG